MKAITFFKYSSPIKLVYSLLYLFSFLFLIVISTFFKFLSVDYSNYFNQIYFTFNNPIFHFGPLEPTFYVISYLSKLFFGSSVLFIFFVYSVIGIGIKFLSFRKLSNFPFISVLIYFLSYFWLQDFTQFRAGAASAFFLFSIPDILNRNFLKFFLKIIIAFLFHYSAIIYLPLYFIYNKKLSLIYYFIPLLGFVLSITTFSITFINFLISFMPSTIGNKIELYMYLTRLHYFPKTNIFNFYYFSLFFLYYFILFNLKSYLSVSNIFYLKIISYSLFIFYFFSYFPVFSFRFSELYNVVTLILFPNIISCFKDKLIVFIFIFFYFTIYFFNFIFIQHSLNILFL